MSRNAISSLQTGDLQSKKVNKWAEARRQPFLLISSFLLLVYGIIFYYVPV